MCVADAVPPRANAWPFFVSPQSRAWIVALLIACLPASAAQAGLDGLETADQGPRSLLLRDGCPGRDDLAAHLNIRFELPLMSIRLAAADSHDRTARLPRLELAALPPRPLRSALPAPPAAMTIVESDAEPAAAMVVGAASMYDPTNPDDKDAGDTETASGETYDPEGWTAAIQIDLRARFGGVRYRMKYEPAYALVEVGDKRAIVRINDVGPLRPGRIIDLNRQAMRFFDPTLRIGVIGSVRVTALPGRHWAVGPVDDGNADSATAIAQASLR